MQTGKLYNYPVQYLNSEYLKSLNGQYNFFLQSERFDTSVAIQEAISHSVQGRDLTFLTNNSQFFLLDMAPYILKYYSIAPSLLYYAILSPTFCVSLFDVRSKENVNLGQWSQKMKNLHHHIIHAINTNGGLTLNHDLTDLYEEYRAGFDVNHLFDNEMMDYFMAIALLDVKHIMENKIPHDQSVLNFSPHYLISCDAPLAYLQNYQEIFTMGQAKDICAGRMNIAKKEFDKMKRNILDEEKISDFLHKKGMSEAMHVRQNNIDYYNLTSYKIWSEYIYHLCKSVQTSPLIQNKEEVLLCVLEYNECIKKSNAALCLIKFENALRKFIKDNLTENEGPFLFKHGNLYSPIPPLII